MKHTNIKLKMETKINNRLLKVLFGLFLIWVGVQPATAQKRYQHQHQHRHGQSDSRINIMCSFSDYASIAEYIARDMAEVQYIAQGEQDPHFVPPKPSYAMLLSKADIWITTGMDLELWSTTLLDKARNKSIMDGELGFVSVSDGVKILQKVEKADRTEGDVHLMGNPHINTSPLNWKVIAKNITTGLMKVDPSNADFYLDNLTDFEDAVDRALFGDALVDLFGGETLCQLLENQTLFDFLERDYQGEKLLDQLGGWLKEALPFRGAKVIAYHKNWVYFASVFGLEIMGYIEPKPGIPPSAKHVQYMINLIREQDIKLMLVATYFEKKSPQMIEEKTGIKALYLPLFVSPNEGIGDNFTLIDYWIRQINTHIK
jgi:ABC-type Zn uptake system ZnuABC Zn-binding protein ZnuA